MKVLNLYAGIGGNRKLWENVKITAIEINPFIANIYKKFFPNDHVIVGDAHQYLLDHFEEFNFIWSSPPCPTHSKIRRIHCLASEEKQGYVKPIYPDMKLYEEILLLQGYFKGKFCVENVSSWYEPLIKPQTIQRHFFWTNFPISKIKVGDDKITGGSGGSIDFWENRFGFDLSNFDDIDKETILRNCVHPKLGSHIFNMAFKDKQTTLGRSQ